MYGSRDYHAEDLLATPAPDILTKIWAFHRKGGKAASFEMNPGPKIGIIQIKKVVQEYSKNIQQCLMIFQGMIDYVTLFNIMKKASFTVRYPYSKKLRESHNKGLNKLKFLFLEILLHNTIKLVYVESQTCNLWSRQIFVSGRHVSNWGNHKELWILNEQCYILYVSGWVRNNIFVTVVLGAQ